MRADGKIEVINRCRKASGEYATVKGKAKIVDKKTNAKLKVTFSGPSMVIIGFWILAQTMNTPWSASLVASIFGY